MKHLTAHEALELTLSKRKNKDEVFSSIRAMANNGNDYACIKTNEILYPEEQQEYWEGLGYTVEFTTDYFKIKW